MLTALVGLSRDKVVETAARGAILAMLDFSRLRQGASIEKCTGICTIAVGDETQLVRITIQLFCTP